MSNASSFVVKVNHCGKQQQRVMPANLEGVLSSFLLRIFDLSLRKSIRHAPITLFLPLLFDR